MREISPRGERDTGSGAVNLYMPLVLFLLGSPENLIGLEMCTCYAYIESGSVELNVIQYIAIQGRITASNLKNTFPISHFSLPVDRG